MGRWGVFTQSRESRPWGREMRTRNAPSYRGGPGHQAALAPPTPGASTETPDTHRGSPHTHPRRSPAGRPAWRLVNTPGIHPPARGTRSGSAPRPVRALALGAHSGVCPWRAAVPSGGRGHSGCAQLETGWQGREGSKGRGPRSQEEEERGEEAALAARGSGGGGGELDWEPRARASGRTGAAATAALPALGRAF